MGDSLRDRIAHALLWTTEEIQPGRGKAQVRIHSMYLDDIQRHTRRGDAGDYCL